MKRTVWISLLALALLVLVQTLMVGAAPPAAPALGITVTPTPIPTLTPTPGPISRGECEPRLRKSVSPGVAGPGDEVVFTITATNLGSEAAVDAYVLDDVPEYLEILEVEVFPEDQGSEVLPRQSQMVIVDVGTIGQGYEVTVRIRARIREDAPDPVCVENVAEFLAPNCPGRSAQVLCWQLPEGGGQHNPRTLAAGLVVAGVLVLGLAAAIVRERLPWRA